MTQTQLDPAIQAQIQQAVDDAAAAAQVDADDAKAAQAIRDAQAVEDGTKAASNAAHKTALASAHDAIQSLANALGFTLPVATGGGGPPS